MFPMKGVLAMELYDGAGNVARFGEVISAGGEGEVRASACWDDVVVKLYRDPLPERRAKVESLAVLGSMINTFGHGPLQHVCWPLCPVYADAHQEEFLGFCMKRAPEGSIPLSELYRYPHVDHGVSHAERVDVLLRLVDILDALHGSSFGGHPLVVGDLSGDNVLVSPCGDLCLLYADTFSFANDGSLYPCMASAPGVAPPELLRAARGRSYQQMAEAGEQTFTVESDRFALASLIFRTLGNGVHPFEGCAEPDPDGDYPLPPDVDIQVRKGASPFVGTAPGIALAPWAIPLEHVPPILAGAYRRSLFSGPGDVPRVTEEQWRRILENYRDHVTVCPEGHAFHEDFKNSAGLPACPYCAADRRFAARRDELCFR